MLPIPTYSDTMKIHLQKRLFAIKKLHELHKIILNSWANWESCGGCILDGELYNVQVYEDILYISPSNTYQFDYGLKQNVRTQESENVGLAGYYLVRGLFKKAYNDLHRYKAYAVPPIEIWDARTSVYKPNTRNVWWENQKAIYNEVLSQNI